MVKPTKAPTISISRLTLQLTEQWIEEQQSTKPELREILISIRGDSVGGDIEAIR
jgi:hypothetical protein